MRVSADRSRTVGVVMGRELLLNRTLHLRLMQGLKASVAIGHRGKSGQAYKADPVGSWSDCAEGAEPMPLSVGTVWISQGVASISSAISEAVFRSASRSMAKGSFKACRRKVTMSTMSTSSRRARTVERYCFSPISASAVVDRIAPIVCTAYRRSLAITHLHFDGDVRRICADVRRMTAMGFHVARDFSLQLGHMLPARHEVCDLLTALLAFAKV